MFHQQHVQIENLCKMAAGWTMVATTAFYSMWGEENVQRQLDSVQKIKVFMKKFHPSFQYKGITVVESSLELKSTI